MYLEQSKQLFSKMADDEWLLKLGIKAYLLKQKRGTDEKPTEEEIAEIRNRYTKETVFYTEPAIEVINN